ncbi:hypothetical protein [Hwanghaeella sp.]|uniref:hypothetical protein n=1 Tax=Hwanghaeella sp. TaxID=2605943 RepID=UPI003CCB7C88
MFDKELFIEDCRSAIRDGQKGIREVVARAVSDPSSVVRVMGSEAKAGIVPLYRSESLTIMHFTWAPYMTLPPHNHNMFSVVGLYSGREDNLFWRRTEGAIEVAGGQSLGAGQVATLGRDIIHSVVNPLDKKTAAFHVYGGDFLAPDDHRSQWNHETLEEGNWDLAAVKNRFGEFDHRYDLWRDAELAAVV